MRTGGFWKRSILSLSVGLVLAGCATTPDSERSQGRMASITPASDLAVSNLNLARSEFGRGNYGNAIEILERELAQKPASVAALNGLGACYDQLGRFDVAQRYYFRALDLAPESSTTLSNIGYSYLQQGRHQEAVALLELALERDSANQVAANNLTMARTGLAVAQADSALAGAATGAGAAGAAEVEALLTRLRRSVDQGDQAVPVSAGSGGNPTARILQESRAAESAPSAAALAVPAQAPQPVLVRAPIAPPSQPATQEQPPAEPASPVIEEDLAPQMVAQQSAIETTTPEPVPPVLEPVQAPVLTPAEAPGTATTALVTHSRIAVVTDVLVPAVAAETGEPEAAEPAPPEPLQLTILEEPELDPARTSDIATAIPIHSEPLNLVVQNGNGVRGIARATSGYLRGDKLSIVGISDAENFDYQRTVIYHRPELAGYALEIAASLNLDCDFEIVTDLEKGADVRVVLGHDFARQVSVDEGWLSFDQGGGSDYLADTMRLEVANGNGVVGMAAKVRSYLQDRGGRVMRITNADHYDYPETILYHRPGMQTAAANLKAQLPISSIRLVEDNSLPEEIDARLVVGQDFVPIQSLVAN